MIADFKELAPLFICAADESSADSSAREISLAARSIVEVVGFLSQSFTLVATNVPYSEDQSSRME